jgi:hypothetical protein
LHFGTLASNSVYHFKMSEMASVPERMERVPIFYRVIENHALISLSCRMNLHDFRLGQDRFHRYAAAMRINVDLQKWQNPYFFLFRGLIDYFHTQRSFFAKRIPLDEPVDFYFDDQSEKSFILAAWNEYLAGQPDEVRSLCGATPRFENDQDFLDLQAADLWAWWVREWYEEDAPDDDMPTKMKNLDFGEWRGEKPRPRVSLSFTEDQILDRFQKLLPASLSTAIPRDFYGLG